MAISPYLRSLRDRVGHDLILMPSVAVFPRDEQGRILLVRNLETGEWQTVGGGIDPDESPAEAARRECREETGLDVELTGIVGVYGGPDFRLLYPNGDLCGYVAIVFNARVTGGIAAGDGEETSEVRWFAKEDTADLVMLPHTRFLIEEAFLNDPSPRFPGALGAPAL
ncbi:MAG: NUDIX domain-containing protein [Geminicoccaceae bacterium]